MLRAELEETRHLMEAELERERSAWKEEQERRARELAFERTRLDEAIVAKESELGKTLDAERAALQAAWEKKHQNWLSEQSTKLEAEMQARLSDELKRLDKEQAEQRMIASQQESA